MAAYLLLLALALTLNIGNAKMLALSAIVGAGILAPVPDSMFYPICILGEILIALCAYRLNTTASSVVMRISTVLVMFHVLGWAYNGWPPSSPYHLMVKISEYAELLACILMSQKITKRANDA